MAILGAALSDRDLPDCRDDHPVPWLDIRTSIRPQNTTKVMKAIQVNSSESLAATPSGGHLAVATALERDVMLSTHRRGK